MSTSQRNQLSVSKFVEKGHTPLSTEMWTFHQKFISVYLILDLQQQIGSIPKNEINHYLLYDDELICF